MSTSAPDSGSADGPGSPYPHIRTFSPRRGRVGHQQQAAIDSMWPAFGVAVIDRPLDLQALFGRRAPVVLEIGFGMGEATAQMAAADPERDLLAIDVHTPGVGALLHRIAQEGLSNVRVAKGDAVELMRDMLAPESLDEIRVFFPDPWPKERHRKRRLVSGRPLSLMASRLAPGAVLHCATDWEPYAQQMIREIDAEAQLVNLHSAFAMRPEDRPTTRFERLGTAKGHPVFDIIARRI